ncbi:MAG: hypothetical protein KKF67_01160 [Nanoarchaeota archaeon]|nr:hypothetical protein [Nanoarchaeota archaeon]
MSRSLCELLAGVKNNSNNVVGDAKNHWLRYSLIAVAGLTAGAIVFSDAANRIQELYPPMQLNIFYGLTYNMTKAINSMIVGLGGAVITSIAALTLDYKIRKRKILNSP